MLRGAIAVSIAAVSIASAVTLASHARRWNDELAIVSLFAHALPVAIDPHTPRLARRVVLVLIDGLGIDESRLPFLDELAARGVGAVARVPYPTISRPNYVTILTGVPPADSGVRANRVRIPVGVDTIFDRVQAAGDRVATASDAGHLGSLFLRNTPSLGNIPLPPAPPITWPIDDARAAGSLAELGPMIATLAAGDASLVAALVLDVDRAGHAAGVGTAYRAAAAATDRMLRVAFAGIDWSRDAVIVTADHGHVAPGGHGGREREVSHVPLILAGAGVVPGHRPNDARLVDVAPTIAALLGIAAPRQAEGRALVESLALSAGDAARITAVDRVREQMLELVRRASPRPDVVRLGVLAAALIVAGVVVAFARRRGAIAFARGSVAGIAAIPIVLAALVVMTRGQLSPSYVPSLPRVETIGGIAAIVGIALQIAASYRALRNVPDRLAAASGIAAVGLGVALTAVAIARAWYAPPFIEVPPPLALIGVPALELAAATCAIAVAITLALAARAAQRQ
jgi:hypothetical protein